MNKDLYTTHEAASLCKVDVSTIKNWINEGKIKAYRTPGGHRRIEKEEIIRFLKEFNMPVPAQINNLKSKLLIVDDNKDIVEILLRLFKKQKWDIEIDTAYDGYEAGKKITSNYPDIIILDNDLPGINGYRILQDVKMNKELAGTKIIAITGKNIASTRKKYISGGVDKFMTKPLDLKKMVETVSLLLGLS